MYAADRFGRGNEDEFGLSWPQALAIGCAQALALMPGHLALGHHHDGGPRARAVSRPAAARFSFLLAVPGIGAAGAYEGLKLVTCARAGGLAADGWWASCSRRCPASPASTS